MESPTPSEFNKLQEDFEDFFEIGLCGFIITNAEGTITRANRKIGEWLQHTPDDLKGRQFSDLLSIGSKIYFETHLRPLLRMQGFFDEVVLELSDSTGRKLQVMVNGFERRNKDDQPSFIRFTILKSSDRLQYEKNLQNAKANTERELLRQTETVALREQLIAVLGHDLRNPLTSITLAAELLDSSPDSENANVLATIKRSAYRMSELVSNIMDFARTRLGQTLVLTRKDILLEPELRQVVDEIRLIYPKREITDSFAFSGPINCDADRLAQLLSNLLANALTHGDPNFPVHVNGLISNGNLELSVTNNGVPIPPDVDERLFEPFARETHRASQNGLGLGLYICSEIAKAHQGSLSFTSTENETIFTFCMKL